jgi:hypothetical protein
MKKRCLLKKTGLVAMVMVMTALVQAQAVDMAAASGILADIAVMAVQAKANLAVAANSGDVDAIADATKRADAVDAAMAEALEAFATLENNPDDIGAIEDMEAARQKADDALNGAVPEATPESMHALWKESQENTGIRRVCVIFTKVCLAMLGARLPMVGAMSLVIVMPLQNK